MRRSTGSTARRGSRVDEQFELPELRPFRSGLLESFGEELDVARQPVFGEAQQAKFISNLNDLTERASQSIAQRLASTGAARSGFAESSLGGLERDRASELVEFFRDLPFREREARLAATTPLLNLGLGFAGRGPVQSRTTAEGSQEFDESTETTGTLDETSRGDVSGPGFGRSAASAGSQILALLLNAALNRRQRGQRRNTVELPIGGEIPLF